MALECLENKSPASCFRSSEVDAKPRVMLDIFMPIPPVHVEGTADPGVSSFL